MISQDSKQEIDDLLADRSVIGYEKEWVYFPSVSRMLINIVRRRRGSFLTFRSYLRGVRRFVEYIRVGNPEVALELLRGANANEIIDEFIEALTGTDLSPSTIKRTYYGLQKWLAVNDVAVDWDRIDIPKVGGRTQDRIPTDYELRHVWNFMNLRDKALFGILLSSGLRVGTLITLRLKDFDFSTYDDISIIRVEGGEGRKLSEGSSYFTFISKETKIALNRYLKSRYERGEKVTGDSFIVALGDGRPFSYSQNVSRRWRNLLKRAGLDEKTQSGLMALHLHVLRKRFQTLCKSGGVLPSYYDFWMGHVTSDYLDDAYFRAEFEKHLEQYRQIVDSLGISISAQVEQINEFRNLVVGMAKARLIPTDWLFFPEPKYPSETSFESRPIMFRDLEEKDIDANDEGQPIIPICASSVGRLRNIPDENEVEVTIFADFLNSFLYGITRKETKPEPTQKVIVESELEEYLNAGWEFVSLLSNGSHRCVIKS
jgi:integrase